MWQSYCSIRNLHLGLNLSVLGLLRVTTVTRNYPPRVYGTSKRRMDLFTYHHGNGLVRPRDGGFCESEAVSLA